MPGCVHPRRKDAFDQAVADFAVAYADLNEDDHDRLGRAVASGRLTAAGP